MKSLGPGGIEVVGPRLKGDGALQVGANSLTGDMNVFVDTFDGAALNAGNWTATQSTAGNVTQNNAVIVLGNSTWTGNGLTSAIAYRRNPTLSLILDVTTPATSSEFIVGFSSAPASLNYTNMPHALYLRTTMTVYENGTLYAPPFYAINPSSTYRIRIDVAAVGATYWISSDGGDTWTKLYDTSTGGVGAVTSPLYPQLIGYNPNGVTLDNVVVSNGEDYLARSRFFSRNATVGNALNVGGQVSVTGTVTAATPTLSTHLTTKAYVDGRTGGTATYASSMKFGID